ncbi:MAG: hypothetical protein WCA32_04880 [Chromatiaceae bacterium]
MSDRPLGDHVLVAAMRAFGPGWMAGAELHRSGTVALPFDTSPDLAKISEPRALCLHIS